MSNEDKNKDLNPLEKQLEEINECQMNANNPGYFVGTGKVPATSKNLFKSPKIMLVIGIIVIIPSAFSLISEFSFKTLAIDLMPLVIGGGLIVGGILRLKEAK